MQINIQPIEKSINETFLEVHSIFYTIQGEGPFAGHPAVFVRLAGCNLQCPSCDTEYTSNRKALTIEQIENLIAYESPANVLKKPLVVITGGEPFRQAKALVRLCNHLIYQGYTVQIETNGTLQVPANLDFGVVIVCSPKTGKVHPSISLRANAWKYVLDHKSVNPFDGLPKLALNHTASPEVARPPESSLVPIYLQPMDTKDPEENLINMQMCVLSCKAHGYILQLQIHKIIGAE